MNKKNALISSDSSTPNIKLNSPLLYIAISLASLSACLYWLDLENLNLTDWPVDYDSFYYLIEFKRQIHSNFFSLLGTTPFFWIVGKFALLFGLTDIQCYTSVVISSFIIFVSSISTIVFDRKRPIFFFWMIYLGFSSKILFFSHYGFLKQSAGMASLALYLAFDKLANKSSHQNLKLFFHVCGYCAGLMATLFHKFSAILMIVIIGTLLINRKPSRAAKIYLSTLVLIGIFLALQSFPTLSSLFSVHWPPLWWAFFNQKIISPYEFVEYLFWILVWASISISILRSRLKFQPLHIVLIAFGFLIMLFATPSAWRSGASIAWLGLLALALVQNDSVALPLNFKTKFLSIIIALTFFNSILFSKNPRVTGPGMSVRLIENNFELIKKWMPSDAFVLAPHGLEFMLIYFFGVNSSHHLPKSLRNGQQIFSLGRGNPLNKKCITVNEKIEQPTDLECLTLGDNWNLVRLR